ncbi:Delta-1-pyrroline-5-carboxylate dehydrogenase 12A1, mitochondrial [Glycine max]|nr:Delta-1-pyrroline-5-carboxylate dehydrogenase 12A1, mitochondrial [Glycine max]
MAGKDNDSLKKSSGSRDQKNDDELPCPVLLPVVSAPIRTQYHGYLMFGEISAKAAHMLSLHKVSDFFTRLIQRISPKSYQQAFGEVYVTQMFLENLCGDQVRFLVRSFAVPGNHVGQRCHGFRWPYGPVTIITPFNFPLEIPALQLMGALYMANKPVLKVDSKNWSKTSLLSKLEDLAERRKLANLTIDSVLTVSIACLLFPPSSNCSRI